MCPFFCISKQSSLAALASALSRRTAAQAQKQETHLDGNESALALSRRSASLEHRMAIALNGDLLATAAKTKDGRPYVKTKVQQPLHEDDGLAPFDYD
jgi:hypothetical protein